MKRKIKKSGKSITATVLVICIIALLTIQVVAVNEEEQTLSNGVYAISNWNTLEALYVTDYNISSFSNVGCKYDQWGNWDDDITEKNELWLVTHLGNNDYSIRPLHKPNMALDVTGTAVDIYPIGTDASYAPSYAKWHITPNGEWSSNYIVNLCGQSSKTLARDPNNSENVYVKEYTGSPDERWGFSRLPDYKAQELEGICIFGPTSVKVGESTTLTAGVYSSETLSQSVTYNSTYMDATVTSNGVVTGVSEGMIGIGVRSTVDSDCRGYVRYAVRPGDRQAVTMVGIPDGAGHDHTGYISNIRNYAERMMNDTNPSHYTEIRTDMETNIAATKLISSDVFIFRGHGSSDSIVLENPSANPGQILNELQRYDFNSNLRTLSSSKLILLIGCSTGEGGCYGDNLVNDCAKMGAKNVIGFSVSIGCNDANKWVKAFMQSMGSQGAITTQTINTALNYAEVTGGCDGTSVDRNNIVFQH